MFKKSIKICRNLANNFYESLTGFEWTWVSIENLATHNVLQIVEIGLLDSNFISWHKLTPLF